MPLALDFPPDDIKTLKGMLIAKHAARVGALQAPKARDEARVRAPLIEQTKFTIARLRHERFGQSLAEGALLEQFELAPAAAWNPAIPSIRVICALHQLDTSSNMQLGR